MWRREKWLHPSSGAARVENWRLGRQVDHTTSPHLIIGESKSFNRFEKRDFARAVEAADLFLGAILCFCTFNEALETEEIKGLTKIAKQGRKRMDVGKRMNLCLF